MRVIAADVHPPGATPGSSGQSSAFVRLDNGGTRYDVSVPPYICARRTGGTSVLQIIKVVDGAETVLKSTAVTNPAIGVPFEIRCQVTTIAPATVSLYLNGVLKLSVPAQ